MQFATMEHKIHLCSAHWSLCPHSGQNLPIRPLNSVILRRFCTWSDAGSAQCEVKSVLIIQLLILKKSESSPFRC